MPTKADLETLYGCEGDAAEHAGDAGHADDAAAAAGHHDTCAMLDPDEDGAHVDRHDSVEVSERSSELSGRCAREPMTLAFLTMPLRWPCHATARSMTAETLITSSRRQRYHT
uniref:Uncharacterized protein n=1 Tax=Oryza brachyantha TaxID=4533 RepID=J3LSH9_ORYBR